MARKKKHVIEYDRKVEKAIPTVKTISLNRNDIIHPTGYIPTPRGSHIRIRKITNNRAEITAPENIPFQSIKDIVEDDIQERASRKKLSITPVMGKRVLSRCERAKAARRAAAFAAGAAGKGKKPNKTKRKHHCGN